MCSTKPASAAAATSSAATQNISAAAAAKSSAAAAGFAQVIDSPHSIQITPMQIDTWNRDHMNLTGGPFVHGPVPRNSLAPQDSLYSGLLDATRKTLQNDGLAGFWLGFRLNIVRTIPQCVVTFTLYEYLSRRLQIAFGVASSAPEAERAQQTKRAAILVRTRSESRG